MNKNNKYVQTTLAQNQTANKNKWEQHRNNKQTKQQRLSNYSGSEPKKNNRENTINKQTTNKYVQTTLAQNKNKNTWTKHTQQPQMFKLLWLGAHGQTSLKIYCFLLLFFIPCVFCFLVLSQSNLKTFDLLFLFDLLAFPCVFVLHVPFICCIGWDYPDPWARGEWWATQRQVQCDSQLAAGSCASFPLRSAVLRSAALRCTVLHCAALRCAFIWCIGSDSLEPWA